MAKSCAKSSMFPFQTRRDKLVTRKAMALPVLSLKSHEQTTVRERRIQQKSYKASKSHFKLNKIQQILDKPITPPKLLASKYHNTIVHRSRQQLKEKLSINHTKQSRNANHTILKLKVLEYFRNKSKRNHALNENSQYFFDQGQHWSSPSKEELSRRTIQKEKEQVLKCQSLSTEISPRKVSKTNPTFQIKNPLRLRFLRVNKSKTDELVKRGDDLCGWDSITRRYGTDYDHLDNSDLHFQYS